jgi:hypothetical protein
MEATNDNKTTTPEAIMDECMTDYKAMTFLTEKSGYSYDDAVAHLKDMPLAVKKVVVRNEARLQKKRDYYKNVVKPKKDAAKQAMQIAVLFEEV